jgi:hypothetical protein
MNIGQCPAQSSLPPAPRRSGAWRPQCGARVLVGDMAPADPSLGRGPYLLPFLVDPLPLFHSPHAQVRISPET